MTEVGKAFVNVEFDENQVGRDLGDAVTKGFILAGAAVAAAGAGLFAIGSSFDSAFDAIRIKTGETGMALAGLEDSFRDVVAEVPTSFGDASEAIAGLNQRLDLTGDPLEELAGQFLELTRLTGGDLSTNIDGITRLLGDWSIPAEDAAETLDQLFRASQATGTGIDQLSAAAVQFGGPMRQLGFTFEETIALVGKFNKEGVNTELVMGSLRIALGRMAREGEAPVETLNRTIEAIKNAGSAGEANALALELFGARAGPDMAAAIREGRFEIDDLVDTIANGSDTIAQASADTSDWGEKWTLIKNRVLLALEPVATRVFNAIGDAMDRLSPIITDVILPGFKAMVAAFNGEGVTSDGFVGFMERVGVIAREVFDWLIANVPPAFEVIKNVVFDVGEAIVKAFGWLFERKELMIGILVAVGAGFAAWAVSAGLAALSTLAAIAPFIAIGVAIAAVVAGVIWAYKNWDIFRTIVDGVVDVLGWLWREVLVPLGGFLAESFKTSVEVVKDVWGFLETAVKDATDVIKWVWAEVLEPVKNFLVDAFGPAVDAIRLIFDSVKTSVEHVGTALKWAWDNVLEPVRNFLVTVFNVGMSATQLVFDAISTAVSGFGVALTWVKDHVINPAIDAFNALKDAVGGALDSFGGSLGGVLTGQFATGGPMVAGQVGWVGERGPELFIPATDGFVIPNDISMGLASGGEGSPMIGGDVIINNPVPEEASESVPRQMKNLAWLMSAA